MNRIVRMNVMCDSSVVNPDLIDFNVVSNGDSKNTTVTLATVEDLSLPPEQFYSMCC